MSDDGPPGDPGSAGDDEESADGLQAPMVVVVDAETPGNVGTIARAMKNFGLSDLTLVDPPAIEPGGEAYGFAGHARRDVLPEADEMTFDEVVETYHTVGFTAITNEDSRHHVRFPFTTPAELAEELPSVDAPTALVFGREGTGLSNEELGRMDEVATIPASEEYPVMNLGQAATVTFYELRTMTLESTHTPDLAHHRAREAELERVHDYWADLLDAAHHPEHKREKTRLMLRRLLGRAHPTDREASTLLGVFRRVTEQLEHRNDLVEEEDLDGGWK